MNDIHPYAAGLVARVARNKSSTAKIKFRKLLDGFGYKRRTDRAIEIIETELSACGLAGDFGKDLGLDEFVTVTLVNLSTSRLLNQDPVWISGQAALTDIAEKALEATVAIFIEDGLGAGFIVHPDGLVVTGRHVVEEGPYSLRLVKVGLMDDKLLDGVVFASHRQLDYALIWLLEDGPFPVLPVAKSQTLRAAQTTLAIGSPNGFHKTVSRGIVSNPRQRDRGIEWIQTDTAIFHGNSGGPLLTQEGAVGISLWGHEGVDAARFALPIDYIQIDIQQAIQYGKKKCLSARYCQACGHTDYKKPVWYCRNCGIEWPTNQLDPQGA